MVEKIVFVLKIWYWWRKGCIGEEKVVLVKGKLYWRRKGCIGKEKVVLVKKRASFSSNTTDVFS